MSVSELSSLRSIVDTVYATHAPSGLMRGSPTVFSSKMSSGVSGRRDCAESVEVRLKPDTTYIRQTAPAVAMSRRFIFFPFAWGPTSTRCRRSLDRSLAAVIRGGYPLSQHFARSPDVVARRL